MSQHHSPQQPGSGSAPAVSVKSDRFRVSIGKALLLGSLSFGSLAGSAASAVAEPAAAQPAGSTSVSQTGPVVGEDASNKSKDHGHPGSYHLRHNNWGR